MEDDPFDDSRELQECHLYLSQISWSSALLNAKVNLLQTLYE